MELEPKHLTPYLPYSLKVVMEGKKTNVAWMSTKYIAIIRPDGIGEYKKIAWKNAHFNIKPILKTLSKLTRDELISEGFDSHIDYLTEEKQNPLKAPYNMIEFLFKNKYDVFGLIKMGLAVEEKIKEKPDEPDRRQSTDLA